ncbi:hypothetical protein K378_01389 [Streptomyces sp. Amel2xB2]|nr:hypothetical protein K378_01389 [Streptomyces sp. Amel2xB2]
MSLRRGAPMPADLRPARHPALAHNCRHCGATAGHACRSQSRIRTMPTPHPSRITALIIATANCPDCQAEPGAPCHDGSRPRGDHHQARQQEAERATA